MKGTIFILGLTGYLVIMALMNPHVGVIGYFGFAVLCPTWNWRWSLPELDYQKFLAISTLLGCLFTGFRGNKFTGAAGVAVKSLFVYLLLCYLSLFQSINPDTSNWFMGIQWKIVLMAIVGVKLVDTPGKVMALIWVLVLAQGYNAYQINDLYFQRGYINVQSFSWNYLDNNTYSNSSLPVIGFSAALALDSRKVWQKLLAAGIFVLQMHQLMILGSRGAMMGGLCSAVLVVVFMEKRPKTLALIAAMTIVGSILAGPSVVEEFSSSFAKEGERDTSAESRFGLWKAGMGITKDHALLGVGPNAGRYLTKAYYPELAKEGKALHNLLFDISTGMGVPGTIAYLLFFGAVWWGHFRIWRQIGPKTLPMWLRVINLATLTSIPGYWFGSMFNSGALIETSYACCAVGAAALAIHDRMQSEWEAHIPSH